MAKPEGYVSVGPILIRKIIKDEILTICAIEVDAEGKKKTMENKVIELLVENIKKYKPEFEVPQGNGG